MKEKMKKPDVFIVDDDRLSLEILGDALEKQDFKITKYNNPLEALKTLAESEKEQCECLILDLMMPEIDGFQFIQKMNEEFPKKEIPIIISSANSDLDSIKKALDLGAYDYFTKPLSEDDLNIMLPKKINNAVLFSRMQRDIILKNEKMSKDLILASQFILKMFPQNKTTNFNYYYKYIPYNEIGGDFVDYIETEDEFVFFLVDISGHGVSAALVASFLKAEFQRYFLYKKDIRNFIYRLNKEFINNFQDSFFCTIFIASYSKKNKKLTYVNAGHPPPILCINEKPLLLKSTGPIVGILENSSFFQNEIEIKSNCPLICYTDGMYEFWLENINEMFGVNRFYKLLCNIYFNLKKKNKYSIKNFVDLCFLSLNSYSKGNYGDDLLMFTIEL